MNNYVIVRVPFFIPEGGDYVVPNVDLNISTL